MIVAKFHETQVKKSSTIHMCICKSEDTNKYLAHKPKKGKF